MKIIVKHEGRVVKEMALQTDKVTVGRGVENDIVLEARRASRDHLEIVRREGTFYVVDKDSGNGTLLNGKEISEAAVKAGDVVAVGEATIEFVDTEQTTPSGTPVPGAKVGCLVGLDGSVEGKRFRLDKKQVTVGRNEEADVVLLDPRSSRNNTRIKREGDMYVIEDLHSANGTTVNGVGISKQPLAEGDTVTIGDTGFRFEFVDMEGIPATAEQPAAAAEGGEGKEEEAAAARGHSGAVVAVLIVLAILAGAGYYFRDRLLGTEAGPDTGEQAGAGTVTPPPPPPPVEEEIPVRLGRPKAEMVSSVVDEGGTVEAVESRYVVSKIGEKIVAVKVKEGDQVAKGAVVVQLDDSGLRNRLDQSRANLKAAESVRKEAETVLPNLREQAQLAKDEWEKLERLVKAGAVTQSDANRAKQSYLKLKGQVDQTVQKVASANANVEVAQAQLKELQDKLADTTIKAPMAGTVSGVKAKVGELCGAGQSLMRIMDTRQVNVVMRVAEDDHRRVSEGMTAQAALPDGRWAKGQVKSKGAQAGRDRMYEVKVLVDNPGEELKPGAFVAHVKIEVEKHRALLIPIGSAVQVGEGYVVYVVREKTAVAVPVRRGASHGELVEVSGNLDETADIVVDGQARLKDGATVRVVSD